MTETRYGILVGLTVSRLHAYCVASTGNPLTTKQGGKLYRWVPMRTTRDPDSLTESGLFGIIERRSDRTAAWRRAGSFQIDPSGKILRGPRWLRIAAGQPVPGGKGSGRGQQDAGDGS